MKPRSTNKSWIPWVSLGCLLILLAFAPYAMNFRPYPTYTIDALYPYRAALVLFGLLATNAALAEFIVTCFRRRSDVIALAPFAAAFLACAVVGWRSYPYWANGVYQVRLGAFPMMDQDPKGLIPMLWIGDMWRVPVVLLTLVCYLAIPVLGITAFIALLRRRLMIGSMTVLCIVIVLVFMLAFSPDYETWLMD